MEISRKVKISYRKHVVHLLTLHCDRFRTNNSFSFVCFNIIQRTESRANINLLIKKKDFASFSKDLKSITIDELNLMATDYIKNQKFNLKSPINRLFQKVQSASACVQGSRASLKHRRNDIRAYMIHFGLPTFYITINPVDVHNPLILFIGGLKIDLDSLSLERSIFRSNFVKKNHFLQAIYFNMVIDAFLDYIIGYSNDVLKSNGILGTTEANYGIVDSQRRGSLHAHFMFWLHNNFTPEELKEKLLCPIFLDKLVKYLESIIKCDFEDFKINSRINIRVAEI